MMHGPFPMVQCLRRDIHSPSDSCWLHSSGFCLGTQ